MASKYDEIRADIRKRGQQAKEELMNRGSSSPAKKTSRFDAIRNRSSDAPTIAQNKVEKDYTTTQNRNEQRMQSMEKMSPASIRSVQPDFLKPKLKPLDVGAQIQNFQQNAPGTVSKNEQLSDKLKQVPVIGAVVKGLDKASNFIKPATDIAEQLYVPGVGAAGAAEEALTQLFAKGTVKAAPKIVGALANISPQAASIAAKAAPLAPKVTAGATVGAYTGAGQQLASHPESSLKEVGTTALEGAGLGAAFPIVGVGLKKLVNRNALGGSAAAQPKPSQNLGIAFGQKKAGPYENLRTDTKSQLVSRNLKEKKPAGQLANKVYRDWVDDLYRLHQTDKTAAAAKGVKELPKKESAYANALASRYSDQIARQMIEDAQVDMNGNVVGESLKSVLSKIPRNKMVDFEDYLVNRHAITRAGRGEKVFDDSLNWTPEQGATKVAQYEASNPEFLETANKLRDYQQNMVQHWAVTPGTLEQSALDFWKQNNDTYVPNKRYFSELEKGGGGQSRVKKGFVGQNSSIKQANKYGSQRKIISPIESIIENTEGIVKAAKRNQVGQLLYKQVQENPEVFKGIAEIVQHEPLPKVSPTGEAPDLIDSVAETAETFSKPRLDRDNVVRVMVDGKPAYMRINEKPLLETLQALGPDTANVVMDALGKVTNVFKNLTTGSNPVFSLARNIWRDIPDAYKNSKSTSNPVTFLGDLLQSAYSILGNKDLYKEYKRMGGGHASPIAADRNLLAQSKAKVLPHQNVLKGGALKAYGWYQDFLNAVETAPRLAEYKRYAQKGDKARGIYESQDVTTNFKRRGRIGGQVDKAVPYFNAATAGLDKFVRSYKDNPAKAITKSILASAVPTAALYALNYDDPNYQKVSKQTKDNFYLIPKGDGTFYRVAKGKEMGAIFSDLPERLMQHFQQKDPEAFADFASQLRETFTPPVVSGLLKSGGIPERVTNVFRDSIAGPAIDVFANKNWADSSIVPGYLQNVSPYLQSDAKTSSLSKKIGEISKGTPLETSPKKLDYLIRQYTGYIGQLGLPAVTPGAGDNPLQAIGSSLKSQVTTDPVFSNDLVSNFYDAKTKYDIASNDSDITGKLPPWYNDDVRKQLGKVSREMSKVRSSMRDIEKDSKLSAADKRDKLREMQEQINRIAQGGLNLLPKG